MVDAHVHTDGKMISFKLQKAVCQIFWKNVGTSSRVFFFFFCENDRDLRVGSITCFSRRTSFRGKPIVVGLHQFDGLAKGAAHILHT